MAAANDGAPSANETQPTPMRFTSPAPAIGFLHSQVIKKLQRARSIRDRVVNDGKLIKIAVAAMIRASNQPFL